MKKITKEILLECAHNLMFDLTNEELDSLLTDFEIITKQMELIGEIDGVDDASPMVFPFDMPNGELREDVPSTPTNRDELLKNTSEVENGQIKLPRVVKDDELSK